MSSWQTYSEAAKASFTARANSQLEPKLVVEAARMTTPEITRRACVKWASGFAEEMKPHLERTWATYDVYKKVDLIRLTLEPLRETCRVVDQALQQPDNKSEKELLLNVEKTLLTNSIVDELRRWAKNDLRAETNPETSVRASLAQNLLRLGWLSRLEACFTEACYEAVRVHAKQFCAMEFQSPMLDLILNWADNVPGPWLRSMLDPSAAEIAIRRLEFFVHQTFGTLRSREFFDIVTSFPDSIPAVDDLKRCLARTHAHRELVVTVSDALRRRLLHSGANTNSILLVYVRLIKTMQRLDPRGVLLEAVAEPIKQYLRSRQETVRCVVTALTNDETGGNSDLYDELGLEDGSNLGPIDFDYDDDNAQEADQEAEADVLTEDVPLRNAFQAIPPPKQPFPYRVSIAGEQWEPAPVEASQQISSKARMSNDILGNLVRVYGSKELFVSEYRQLLGERLLNKTQDFNTDAEVRRLELLKLRFGEATMLSCEVMLRDVAESRRVSQHISGERSMETIIVSRRYWPQFAASASSAPLAPLTLDLNADPAFKVHRAIKSAMDETARKYAQFKKPRKLVWSTNFGLVDLVLTFPDNTAKSYENLTTLQANIALTFGDRREWALNELSTQLGVEPEVVKKRIAFWVADGAILEDKDAMTFTVAATAPSDQAGEDDDEFEAEEDAMDVEQAQREMMQAHQEARDRAQLDFITTMLTNLGASSLDVIHRNLQLFGAALQHGYDRNEQELAMFLTVCVEKGALEFVDDKFQVPPEG